MFNASGIVQNILNGSITYTELLRDISTVQQTTSNAIGPDYFVNLLAAMGNRLTFVNGDLASVPFDSHVSIATPEFMRAASIDLSFIKTEPFQLLPGWQELFARVEILLPETMTIVAYRETYSMKNLAAQANQNRHVPSQMVCFPAMSLKDGKVKLVRMSLFSFVKSAAAILAGGACTIVGHHTRKRVQPCTATLSHSFDIEQAAIEAAPALEALRAEYAQPNQLTYEQGCMLRTLLDTRKRDAAAMQARVSQLNPEPKGKGNGPA